MITGNKKKFEPGLALLKKPVMPLVGMVQFLYLTGPFETVGDVLNRLTKPVELEGVIFENPRLILIQYSAFLNEFEVIKGKRKPAAVLPFIVNEKDEPVAKRQALEVWIKQQILSQELATINSKLCGPCGCALCCAGPNSGFEAAAGFKGKMKQEFFEVPLEDSEVDLFSLGRVDTEESRAQTVQSNPPLHLDRKPFYRCGAKLIHWENGWSMILPQGSVCPRLSEESKKCRIYAKRPLVCRKPQIFAYILEKTACTAKRSDGVLIPVYMARNKILAVWDCPYVRKFQDEIGNYAELSGLEPVFKKSKA